MLQSVFWSLFLFLYVRQKFKQIQLSVIPTYWELFALQFWVGGGKRVLFLKKVFISHFGLWRKHEKKSKSAKINLKIFTFHLQKSSTSCFECDPLDLGSLNLNASLGWRLTKDSFHPFVNLLKYSPGKLLICALWKLRGELHLNDEFLFSGIAESSGLLLMFVGLFSGCIFSFIPPTRSNKRALMKNPIPCHIPLLMQTLFFTASLPQPNPFLFHFSCPILSTPMPLLFSSSMWIMYTVFWETHGRQAWTGIGWGAYPLTYFFLVILLPLVITLQENAYMHAFTHLVFGFWHVGTHPCAVGGDSCFLFLLKSENVHDLLH